MREFFSPPFPLAMLCSLMVHEHLGITLKMTTTRSIPFSQSLCLRRLCSENEDFHTKSLEMRDFFVQQLSHFSFRHCLLEGSKASQIPQSETLTNPVTNVTENNQIPLVLTFHPFNFKVRDIIRKNFHILKNDPVLQ